MRFILPFRMCVSGSSNVGKTTFVCKLLLNRNKLFVGEAIKKIIWCCRDKNFFPHELKNKNIVIHEGLIPVVDVPENSLVVYDDLMLEIGNSKDVCELLTVNSSHRKISVIVLTQNLYHSSVYGKTMQLNFSYNVIFKNLRDRGQIKTFLRQAEPDSWRALWENVYKSVLSRPYSYLVVDFTPKTNDIFRFTSDIFEPGWFTVITTADNVKRNSSKLETVEEEFIYLADFEKM